MKKKLILLGATAAAAAAIYGGTHHSAQAPAAHVAQGFSAADDSGPRGGKVVANPFDDGKTTTMPSSTAPSTPMPTIDEASPAEPDTAVRSSTPIEASPAPRASVPPASSTSGESCDDGKRYCKQMTSCADATFHLKQCGMSQLDGDHDGVPCESLCGH